ESRKVTEALAREAIANFADARQAFVAFVETNWDHAELAEVPRLLGEVSGALQMLDLPQPAHYLAGVSAYTERELIGKARVPSGRQLDTLADALASLEYYLEALREQRPNRDDILDVARNSLEALNYWPIPEAPATPQVAAPAPSPVSDAMDRAGAPPAGDVDATARFLAGFEDAGAAPAAPQATPTPPAQAPVPPAPPAHAPAPVGTGDAGGFETTGDEIDDEIREIFLEEFEEEIGNLSTLLPEWRADPESLEQLRPIRRVFHTLKGSGRLVGAKVLGEFAWKVENMLNRVLDGSRPPSPAVVALVGAAHDTLPQLLSALRGDGGLVADLAGIQALADRIAAGEEAFLAPEPAAAPPQPAAESDVAPTEVDAGPAVDEAPQTPAAAEAEGIPASVDAVLLEILDAEVGGHLVTLDRWLASVRETPAPASDALLRAIHTMNGAFAMTEVPAITHALTPAEGYIKRMLAAGTTVTAEGVAALSALGDAVRATISALHTRAPRVQPCDALGARLSALRDSLPDVQVPPLHDEDAHGAAPCGGPDLSDFVDTTALEQGLAGRDDTPGAHASEPDASSGIDAAQLEIARLEAERLEREAEAAAQLEGERLAAERAEAERATAERAEAERLEAERL